jgi:hypothetical protein
MHPLTEETYLWEHWKFNADQRIRAFNFYVVFAIFGNGMVFSAFDRQVPGAVLVLLGGFIGLLAVVFAIVDARSRHLLHLTKEGLKAFEHKLPIPSRPFLLDDVHRSRWVRYTVAFNLLFGAQLLFGLMVIGWGIAHW